MTFSSPHPSLWPSEFYKYPCSIHFPTIFFSLNVDFFNSIPLFLTTLVSPFPCLASHGNSQSPPLPPSLLSNLPMFPACSQSTSPLLLHTFYPIVTKLSDHIKNCHPYLRKHNFSPLRILWSIESQWVDELARLKVVRGRVSVITPWSNQTMISSINSSRPDCLKIYMNVVWYALKGF